MKARTREAYGSPQLHFGVALEGRMQTTIPGAGSPVLLKAWTWGPYVARECPSCRCTPEHPCTITLAEECGEAACVPAGAYGSKECSACAA